METAPVWFSCSQGHPTKKTAESEYDERLGKFVDIAPVHQCKKYRTNKELCDPEIF